MIKPDPAQFSHGTPVMYYPVLGGPGFPATCSGKPWRIGHTWVVCLKDLGAAYADYVCVPGKSTVQSATLTHLELLEPESWKRAIAGHPGENRPDWKTVEPSHPDALQSPLPIAEKFNGVSIE